MQTDYKFVKKLIYYDQYFNFLLSLNFSMLLIFACPVFEIHKMSDVTYLSEKNYNELSDKLKNRITCCLKELKD